MTRYLVLAFLITGCSGCQPTPVPVPPTPAPVTSDAGPAPSPKFDAAPPKPSSPYTLVCQNLARLACPEGKPANCASVLEHAATSGLTPVNVPCLQAAPNATAVRACGFVKCAGVP